MKSLLGKLSSSLLLVFCWPHFASAQSSFDLVSPDKRIEVRVRTAEGIHYDVVLDGREILRDCSMSLDVEHTVFGKDLKVTSSKTNRVDETLTPVVRQKFAKIRDNHNELHVEFAGNFAVDFRAYNEGVAYRFETSLPSNEVKVYGEEGSFRFPRDAVVFYPQEDSF